IRLHLVARDVHAAAIHRPVAVGDELSRLAARGCEPESDQNVVQAALEQPQKVLARHALLAARLVVVARELGLEHLVVALRPLLLTKLSPVLGLAHPAPSVLTRRVGAALDAALVREAARALEEELLALASALLALGGGIACHLDAPPLPWTAAVVGLRRHVLH